MVLLSAGLHALQEAAGVGGAVNDRHVERLAAQIYLGLPYAFISSDRAELEKGSGSRLAGEIGVGGTERGLHHAAGVAKDDAGAGGLAHQGVVGGVLQSGPVHTLRLGPAGKLTGGDDLVGIPHALRAVIVCGGVHLLPADLEFLGRARSQGHVDNLPGVQSHLLSEIGLDGGTLHPDGALGRGEVGQQLGRVDLREMDPAGTAAGELGEGLIALGQAAEQLTGLLHDGEIGGEIGVQHVVGAQRTEQGHHFSLHKGARRHAELLAQRGADCGRGADHHHLVGVGHRLTHLRALVPLGDAVHRAGVGALTAVDAHGFSAGFLQRVGAVYAHQIGTGHLAHAAPDTLLFPAHDAGVVRLNGHADG